MRKYNKILEAIQKGINIALDDFDDEEIVIQKNSKLTDKNQTKEYLDLMNYVVDLGLPSGTLWSKYNLGCDFDLLNTHPEDTYDKKWYGNYYAWGELKPNKKNYDWKTYLHCNGFHYVRPNLTKYCNNLEYGYEGYTDNFTKLLPEDDVVYQSLHIYDYKFSIPTEKQFNELLEYTTNKVIEQYAVNGKIIEGLYGWEFTSIINGNKLFIPAAGYYNGKNYVNQTSFMWTANLYANSPRLAYTFKCNSLEVITADRCCGCTIRPVVNLK